MVVMGGPRAEIVMSRGGTMIRVVQPRRTRMSQNGTTGVGASTACWPTLTWHAHAHAKAWVIGLW